MTASSTESVVQTQTRFAIGRAYSDGCECGCGHHEGSHWCGFAHCFECDCEFDCFDCDEGRVH